MADDQIILRFPMDTTALPATKAERNAFVNQMFAAMQPADKKSATLTDLLMPIRGQLRAKRRQGFTLTQIAEALKASRLKCEVSPSMLKVILQTPAEKRRASIKRMAAERAANLAAAKAVPASTSPLTR
jgi:hypothetical protein